ncbi:MAG: 16S rRNA (cytosine(967)-C(5))-methyltransferase RsmB [Clostridiales Family XIII bacterium]|jgi:16S rRNA (cytosine967-C5)-methyltransferase|nr:16S rRNA (cytosine(967)-C(5))-methyltransferase RsmB [Clostridiales Family XIII bacterium]
MDINRKTAFYIVRDVENKKAYSHIAANNHINRLKPSNRPFVRELAFGVIRQKMYLDYVIGNFVKTPTEKLNVADLSLLRMGLYQIIFMNSVPDYAAVNETVEMAGRYAKGREGFVNGVLRQYLRDRDYVTLPERDEDETRYLSVKYSYEPWIVKMWLDDFGAEDAEKLLAAGNEIPPLTIRVNTLMTDRDDLSERLTARGYEVSPLDGVPNMLCVKGEEVIGGRFYKSGLYSIQDEGSLCAVRVLDPKPGETVVDVCAAPGGKTMAIAEAMNNKGRISAIDLYKRKLYLIREQAKRLGVTIVDTWSWDATRADSDLADTADRVLVDAPCSGLGTVRKKPEIKYKKWDDEMEDLPLKQRDILAASSKYVKPGGVLVYAVCTVSRRESQQVVNDFLRRHADFEKTETKQLLPNIDNTDGFFICKMKRRESLGQREAI